MMEDTELQKIVDDLTLYSGKTISNNKEIKEQLKQAQVKRIKEQGRGKHLLMVEIHLQPLSSTIKDSSPLPKVSL